MNNVVLIGRITRDVELRFIPSTGLAVAKFNLAVDREMSKEKKQEAAAQGIPTADFINITVFGKSAENCANYLNKGNKCAIQGKISTGSYTTQTGEKRYTFEVVADRVEFLESKGQAKPQENFDFPDDDEGLFMPVDDEDMDLIPF
jgi:single-strand DNA-binding protein